VSQKREDHICQCDGFQAGFRARCRAGESKRIAVGLHLNFSEEFTDKGRSEKLREYHIRIVRFLKGNKHAQPLYDLFLPNAFADSCQARCEEFVRLFKKAPSHIDGHHHMDLCANLVLSKSIPADMKMRRNFSFWPGEKGFLNRPYRGLVDRWLIRKYRLPDYFFDLTQCL
jgi:hypothetical protein